MEIEQDPLPPHLSFAYNHSLVKHLATSKPKHTTMNTKHLSCVVVDDNVVSPNQNLKNHAQQHHHKKQVRRRLHTGRPCQERHMNMAEARREILTALKYHRAAMKQVSEEQGQHQQSLSLQPSHVSSFDQNGRFKSRRNPRLYPSCTTKISSYMDEFSYSSSFSSHPPPPIPNSYFNTSPATSPFAHPAPKAENPNFILPETWGLTLNLHHFKNLESTLFLNNNNNNNNTSPVSFSSPLSIVIDQDVPSIGISHSQGEGVSSVVDIVESKVTSQAIRGLHTTMDDKGMAEIRSLGEQHQMKWNDTMSLVTSAWWFHCLKNTEYEVKNEDGACHIFNELNEFSTWLNNANEMCSEDYFQDSILPR